VREKWGKEDKFITSDLIKDFNRTDKYSPYLIVRLILVSTIVLLTQSVRENTVIDHLTYLSYIFTERG
jgi:hypothetical protein